MEYYIYLLQIFGGGNPKIHDIINACGGAKQAYERISGGDLSLIPNNRLARVKTASLDYSRKTAEYCRNNGIDIVTIDDSRYPKALKNIFNPPVLLFVSGSLSCLDNTLSLSVVGPRAPDEQSQRYAQHICSLLAKCSVTLVSGFAHGIDRIAHQSSISCKKPTVAVLACGITVDYPAHSFDLRNRIVDCGGAVVSELMPDTPVSAQYFKFRNRIISGLSQGTAVIGADNKSGSLITANHAFEQDRELFFTLPADTESKSHSRIIRFLRDGAHPVYDGYDIINEFYAEYSDKIDSSCLDKELLSDYIYRGNTVTQPQTPQTEAVKEKSEPIRTAQISDIKDRDEEKSKAFRISDGEGGGINYMAVTPSRFLSKACAKPKNHSQKYSQKAKMSKSDEPKPHEVETVKANSDGVKPRSRTAPKNQAPQKQSDSLSQRLVSLIREYGSAELDTLIAKSGAGFDEVMSTLCELEISGSISCGAGNVYTIAKKKR